MNLLRAMKSAEAQMTELATIDTTTSRIDQLLIGELRSRKRHSNLIAGMANLIESHITAEAAILKRRLK